MLPRECAPRYAVALRYADDAALMPLMSAAASATPCRHVITPPPLMLRRHASRVRFDARYVRHIRAARMPRYATGARQ